MHPVFAHRNALVLWLSGWAGAGLLIAALFAVPGGREPLRILVVILPSTLVLRFMALSARYLCAANPIGRSSWARLLAVHTIAAALTSALWVAGVAAWGSVAGPLAPPEVRLLFGFGVVLF